MISAMAFEARAYLLCSPAESRGTRIIIHDRATQSHAVNTTESDSFEREEASRSAGDAGIPADQGFRRAAAGRRAAPLEWGRFSGADHFRGQARPAPFRQADLSYFPAMVMPSMRSVGAAVELRKSRSLPMAVMLRSISRRFPAMVISWTGKVNAPFSIQRPAAPRE